jgi:hypothetical protein
MVHGFPPVWTFKKVRSLLAGRYRGDTQMKIFVEVFWNALRLIICPGFAIV